MPTGKRIESFSIKNCNVSPSTSKAFQENKNGVFLSPIKVSPSAGDKIFVIFGDELRMILKDKPNALPNLSFKVTESGIKDFLCVYENTLLFESRESFLNQEYSKESLNSRGEVFIKSLKFSLFGISKT